MFAVPHMGVVFAGRLVQSAAAQQPDVGMHRLVPGQFLNPAVHMTLQVPDTHTAVPLEEGGVQLAQAGPQKLVLVSG